MLKYQINKREAEADKRQLPMNNVIGRRLIVLDDKFTLEFINKDGSPCELTTQEGNSIYFRWTDTASTTEFSDKAEFSFVGNSKNKIRVGLLDDIELVYSSSMKLASEEGLPENYCLVFFSNDNEFVLEDVPKEEILTITNGVFLRRRGSTNEIDNESFESIVSVGDEIRTVWIPVNTNGEYLRNSLLFKKEDTETRDEWDEFVETLPTKKILRVNQRYYKSTFIYTLEGKRVTANVAFKEGSVIEENNAFFRMDIPFSVNMANNTQQQELITENFIAKELENIINSPFDYEKKCFEPYKLHTDGKLYPCERINFNFHFRVRNNDWVVKEGSYWNGYTDGGPTSSLFTDTNEQSDLLGYLDFSNDDVYYQKSKLKKSFLRLIFCDKAYEERSLNPTNQSTLFYSTIFVDTNALYEKYTKYLSYVGEGQYRDVKNKKMAGIGVNNEYTPVLNENKRLGCRLTVLDKYNLTKSSEGFYVYLFNNFVPKDGEEKTIYMKAEFNHAKFGKTIPMMWAHDTSNNEIQIGKPGFPTTFTDITDPDNKKIEITEYYRHLYIPITIKYSETEGKYIYYINGKTNEKTSEKRTLNLNLWEPKFY